ncbi:MAG: hypothetical protein ACREJA_07310, partial [Candidatus Methylomirabilales bacterium]
GTQRWATEGFSVESAQGGDRVIAQGRTETQALHLDFLQSGERLIRIHRFRYVRAVGCTLGGLLLTVEESLGDVPDTSRRCVARPDHPERVPRPELTVYGETVEAALRGLIEKLRARRPPEIFLPTE